MTRAVGTKCENPETHRPETLAHKTHPGSHRQEDPARPSTFSG
jgi:hypothetical protein